MLRNFLYAVRQLLFQGGDGSLDGGYLLGGVALLLALESYHLFRSVCHETFIRKFFSTPARKPS